MRVTRKPKLTDQRPARAVAGMLLISALSGCGGGLEDDSHGQADRLICATACQPSSSLSTGQIRPSFVVVSDGTRVQAQAGFSSGRDPRFNVEIDGSDSLRLVTAHGTQAFHIPAGSLATIVVDALRTLVTGATPYLSELAPSPGAEPMQFHFVRSAATHISSVELPAPFQIVSPALGATMALGARTLSVRLTSAVAATLNSATFNCSDVNGNTAAGTPSLNVVADSLTSDASGVTYSLAVGEAIDELTFSTTYPRGAVASCDIELQLIAQAQGQADPQFKDAQIFAQQIRSVSITAR
jgi:hypothetical protein